METGHLFIGTSGYTYDDWVGVFYPNDLPRNTWLSYYTKHFNTLEINATFYHSFKRIVFENWYKKTPKNFAFAIKGSRFITHVKRIKDVRSEVQQFFDGAKALGEKLAVVLWQFPASFVKTDETVDRLSQFLSLIPRYTRHTFEFRHASWFEPTVYRLLKDHHAGLVTSVAKKFPATEEVLSSLAYIRFHGPVALYASSYSRGELTIWAKKIKTYLTTSDVYCYFNNDVHGCAVENAKTLRSMLE